MSLLIRTLSSKNYSEREYNIIDTIILHHTATPTCKMALNILTDAKRDVRVSSHYVIDRDGTIYQLVDNEKKAWHAGVSFWRGREKINEYSIGIEIVNTGFNPFPEPQMQATLALCKNIMAKYKIDICNVVGHSDIAPGRKIDPNEYFNWKMLAEHGVGIYSFANCENPTARVRLSKKVYENLHTFGYHFDERNKRQVTAVVRAFKRHHVPENYADLGWDRLSQARLTDLLERYYE